MSGSVRLWPPATGRMALRLTCPDTLPGKTDRLAALHETRLAYWDTGGTGPVVTLLHAATGSKASWDPQRPVLQQAGYRVVGYSRRGHLGSDRGSEDSPGTGSGDLLAWLDELGIDRCQAVGTAAGAIVAADFALSHPDRLHSLTLACTILGVVYADYAAVGARLRPPGFDRMPVEFQELGPSCRAENPEGVVRWIDMERSSILDGARVRQATVNRITCAALRGLTVPCLLINGDADLWSPPSVQRMFARNLPHAETVVIREAGHSAAWEQPAAFNQALLDFLGHAGPGKQPKIKKGQQRPKPRGDEL